MNIIKRFCRFLLGRKYGSSSNEASPEPVIVRREEHIISRKQIDSEALKVLNRLNRFGHTAYLVGGGVRDLLLGRPVKDFDVATSAHPNEIKRLFRNCRLIGRRFRLAHILFRGRKVIEVSTFRRHAGFGDNGDLLIKSDNTFGTAEEDARRRDLTINGLFYNISDFSVIDYVGGLKDLNNKVIRTIGDPETRFREDPIRILRAIRLSARLEFTIDPPTREAIERHREEIWKGAAPRILEELLRLLQQGAASASFRLLHELGVLKVLLPRLAADFNRPEVREWTFKNLENTDRAPKSKEVFSPALLISILYLPAFTTILREQPEETDRGQAAGELLEADLQRMKFPKLQLERAKQLLVAQSRLGSLGKKRVRPGNLVRKAYFAEALTLFEISQPSSGSNRSIARRWRTLQQRDKSAPPTRRHRGGSPRTKNPPPSEESAPATSAKPKAVAAVPPANDRESTHHDS